MVEDNNGIPVHSNSSLSKNNNDSTSSNSNMEEELSKDLALFLSNPNLQKQLADGSLDLTSYSSTIEKELYELENQCIDVYRRKEKEIFTLKEELKECDTIVLSLQEMLLGFQADLDGLSGEIRTLQEKSNELAIQLSNRHNAINGMSTFLKHILLPPNLVYSLINDPVNTKEYVQCVKELQTIYRNTNETAHLPQPWACGLEPTETISGKEMSHYVQNIRWVVIKRIREYFLLQLTHLRRPQTNIRMIQVHGLLQYASLQDFLLESCPEIAIEIYNVYVESMSKTLFSLFRTYQLQLLQLDCTRTSVTRQDVIAIDDATLRDSLTTKAKIKKRVTDVFCLGNRANDVLLLDYEENNNENNSNTTTTNNNNDKNLKDDNNNIGMKTPPPFRRASGRNVNTPNTTHKSGKKINAKTTSANNNPTALQPIIAHVAMREKIIYPYERLFRSLLGHLVEAVTNEYIFCRQFFKCDAFGPLFNGTLSLLSEQLENYLFDCHDMLCILLMIKITHEFNRLLRGKRKIHSLDNFFQSIIQLLWPRLKSIMDNHRRSINTTNVKKLGGIDLHPHYISRRFAEFTCSILLILNKKKKTKTKQQRQQQQLLKQRMLQQKHQIHDNKNSADATKSTDLSATTTGTEEALSLPSPSRSASTDGQLLLFSGEKSAGDMLLKDLNDMLDDFINLLERLADEHTNTQDPNSSGVISSSSLHQLSKDLSPTKKRIIFLINNLDNIVCIYQERRVIGNEFNKIIELLMHYREIFVEEELLNVGNFSKLIAFVQQTESYLNNNPSAIAAGAAQNSNINMDVVQSLVYDFKNNWKNYIEQINKNVLSYFSNFRNGMEILKQVLTQLLLYYTRFQDIIRKVWGLERSKQPAFCKEGLVNTTIILAEIKKYALAI